MPHPGRIVGWHKDDSLPNGLCFKLIYDIPVVWDSMHFSKAITKRDLLNKDLKHISIVIQKYFLSFFYVSCIAQ